MKFFFALLGVALAAHTSLPVARPLDPKNEYRYRYESTLTYSIPVPNTESSLTRMRAEVIIHEPTESISLLRLDNIEVASANDVTSTVYRKFETLEKRSLSEEHLRLLKLPFRVDHENSVVTEMYFSSEELPWTMNVKKAIVNMLQINLKAENLEKKYFTTIEKTIEGECEVAYTIIPEDEKTLVTKTVNFEKCERRSALPYNQNFAPGCPDCDFNMIIPQTVSYIRFEKEQLKEVEIRSTYSISLKDQPMMKTENNAKIVFLGTNELRHKMHVSKENKQELIYSTEWENSVEKFFKMGDDAEYNPFKNYTRKIEMIDGIVSSLSKIEENTPESVHLFTRLAHALRRCSQEELRKVHDRIWKKSDAKKKTIILHALAVAGTKNTVEHLLTRHAEMMSPMKLAQLLKSIQETPYPSEHTAELLYKFSKTELCRSEPVIRQSVWLAYGAIVRGVVVPTMEMKFVKGTEQLKEKFLINLRRNWEEAETIYEKILALKTFANAGIDISIGDLETIIYDKKQPTAVRMEAIDSLRLLSEQLPHRIQRLLMPIYNNRLEKSELRMSSLVQMLQAKPQQPELYQIVKRMEREPNKNVATFTYTLLKSVSESTLPVFRNVSTVLAPMLRVSQFRPESHLFSVYQRLPWFHEETFTGLNLNFGAVFGKDSAIPKDMMTSLETVFGGNWNKYLLQLGFSHQNVELLFNKIISKFNILLKEAKTTIRASRVTSSVSMLKELARKLNIRVRETGSEEAHAMFYLRYKQMDYAFLPINEQIIDDLIEKYVNEGNVDINKFMRLFAKEMEFDFTHAGFFFESRFVMPTTAGLPLTISAKLPTVLSAQGSLTLAKRKDGFMLHLQSQPTLATTHVYMMSTPIFEHGIKFIRSAQLTIPIDVELIATMDKEFEIILRHRMPEHKKTLVRVESRPVAFIREFNKNSDRYTDAKEKTISLPNFAKATEDRTLKTEWAGLEFVLSGMNTHPWTMENVVLGEYHMDLAVHPTARVPEEISVHLRVGRVQSEYLTKKTLMRQMEAVEGNSELQYHIQKMVDDLDLNTVYKHTVFLTLSAIEKTEVVLASTCDAKLSFCTFNTEISYPRQRLHRKLTNIVGIFFPKSVSSVQELKEHRNPEVQVFSKTMWGTEQENIIKFTAQLKQSEDQRKLVKENRSLRGLPAYELLTRLARFNQIKAVANYELTPEAELMFERLFDLLKTYTIWNSQVERADNESQQLKTEFTVDPLDSTMSQLYLKTPSEVLRLENVQMPFVLPSLARLPQNTLRHSPIEKSQCTIKEGKVYSFDDVIYRVPLSTCYTLVAKDCSENPLYAVLVKNVEKYGDEKMIKIIYDEKEYELEIVDGKMKATVDKQRIVENELEEYSIKKIGELLYVIDLEEVVVRFDGYGVETLINNKQMNSQCGICGHFDGEKENDYRTASNEETEDLEKFYTSYMLRDQECSLPEKKFFNKYAKDDTFDAESRKKFESSEELYEKEETLTTDVKMTIRVQEFAHRTCFSLEKVPECPKNYTAGKPAERKVRFGCLPRHDSAARRILAAIRRGDDVVLGDYVEDLKLSFVDNILLPQTCIMV